MPTPTIDPTVTKRLPDKAFLYHVVDKQDDPYADSLLNGGVAGMVQKKYEAGVSKIAWAGYDGMWRAASSGIMRGILVASAMALGAAAVGGMFYFHATSNTALPLIDGAIKGIGMLLSSGPLVATTLSIGAAGGAIHDVSNHRDAMHVEMAKTRQLMRDAIGETQDIEQGMAQAHEHVASPETPPVQEFPMRKQSVAHDFDPTGVGNPQIRNDWAARETARLDAQQQQDTQSRGRA